MATETITNDPSHDGKTTAPPCEKNDTQSQAPVNGDNHGNGSPPKQVTPERVYVVDDNYNNVKNGKQHRGMLYLDDDVLLHYKYFNEEGNDNTTTVGSYLGTDD